MTFVKFLMLAAVLFFAPTPASAGFLDGLFGTVSQEFGDDSGDDHPGPVIPEPSGALVMGVALAAVAVAALSRRK